MMVSGFDPTDSNYAEWLDSVYVAPRFLKLSRWAIPLQEGELGVRKAKPAGKEVDEDKVEEWEDQAEKALAVVSESLGSLRWIIKECSEPDQAFKVMHERYSGATSHDAIKSDPRWVNEKPKGDSFREYISTMTLIKEKLNAIGSRRTEKDLCLRMMTPLSQYPDEHPLREAYKWLDNKFRDSPGDITITYFSRYVQSAMEKLSDDNHTRTTKMKNDDTNHALLTRLVEHVLTMSDYGKNTRSTSHYANYTSNPAQKGNYSGCHFCKSMKHQIANCDAP
jgi:hypothetical protein